MKILNILKKARLSDSCFTWLIAISSMVVMTGTFGIFRSSGVLYAEVIDVFNVERELAAWPFAVAGVLNSFAGIISGPMTTVLPMRTVVMFGIGLSALGLGMCYFASGIVWMTVFYGVFFGLGTGLVYVCLPMIINDFFKKNKTTANGILLAGTPLGVMILAPLSEKLIITFALRGTFLLLSAVTVQTLVFAAIMKSTNPTSSSEPTEGKSVVNNFLCCEETCKDSGNLDDDDDDSLNYEKQSLMLENNNRLPKVYSQSENNLLNLEGLYSSCREPYYYSTLSSLNYDFSEHCVARNFDHVSISESQKHQSDNRKTANMSTEVTFPGDEIVTQCAHLNLAVKENDSIPDTKESHKRCLCLKVLQLITKPMFGLMTFNFLVVMTSIQTVTVVLVDYGEDKGLSRESAVMLLTVVAVPEFFCRTCTGWITDKGFVKKEYLLLVSQCITGVVVFTISLVYSKVVLCILLALFGICTSSLLVVLNVFCVDNFQKELLGFAFGIRHATMILTCITRPWIIGIFRDHFGSYDYLFQAVGGTTAISGFLWAITLCSSKKKLIVIS